MTLVAVFKHKAFDVWEIVIVGIIEYGRPNNVGVIFADILNVGIVVIVQVAVCEIVVSVLQNDEDAVIAGELTQICAVLLIIDAMHVSVKPDFSSA